MRIALLTCLPDNFLVCWPPVRALSVFHGNLPQKIWGTYFPHGESTSWNFPAKIRNSLRPIPSFDMMSKFPGSDHSCRRRYVALLLAEEGIITRKTTYASVCKSRTKQTRKKVTGVTRQWTEVTRTSTDCQTTFLDVWSNLENFWKKSLNGHATVVEVTRPSADCQTTFFRRFKQLEIFLKKVAERSRDSGRRSRDRRPTVKHRFLDVLSNLGKFWKKVAERSRDSGRRSRDRRPTVKQRFLDVSSDFGKFWKKSLNGHATVVGGHATVGRLSNNVFWMFQAIWENFEKKSLNGHATVVGGHATVGWLPNNVFWTFQAIWENFEKCRWTVTRQWSEVTRPSADCQTTFLNVSSNKKNFWKNSLNGYATVVGGHATVGRLSNIVF